MRLTTENRGSRYRIVKTGVFRGPAQARRGQCGREGHPCNTFNHKEKLKKKKVSELKRERKAFIFILCVLL